MDTKTLLNETKARFSHNSAKIYLKEKYESQLFVADQGGLWKANPETINFLNSMNNFELVVMIDVFDNPVKVNVAALKDKLITIYNETMDQWHLEWCDMEKKR